MNIHHDLLGKTITGVIASTEQRAVAREIWMLQFSDGTHVEFVSPRARKGLRHSANRPASVRQDAAGAAAQLSLNVA